ncbi:MAG: 4Fe-4S binding protein [Pseudomonadota bacterium]
MDLKKQVEALLEQGEIDIFLGYRRLDGHSVPHGFTRDNLEDLEDFCPGQDRYPLETVARHLHEKDPQLVIGILTRECNGRALNVLYSWNKLNPENIRTIGLNCCPSPLKSSSDCSYLNPATAGQGKQAAGVDPSIDPEVFMEQFDGQERFSRWMYEFGKCIKCYGCRNICPVCFCLECSLEHPDLVEPGTLPPEIPIFHLVRAVHMAGRCIDCGLCESACPAEIPLRLLYREVNRTVGLVFDFRPGETLEKSPLTLIGTGQPPALRPMDA